MNDFLDSLYANIGTKIKNFVKWSFFVEVIAILISGFIAFVNVIADDPGMFIAALIIVPVGIIVAIAVVFVSSWAMYAFGDLVDNANQSRLRTECIYEQLQNSQSPVEYSSKAVKKSSEAPVHDLHKPLPFKSQDNRKTDGKWKCPQCHWINSEKETECVCGYRR